MLALGNCRQGDDIVAIQSDSGLPPAEDAGVLIPDVSIERDAPPPTIDVEIPRPDAPVDDVVIPPVDALPPTGCEATGPILSIKRASGATSESCAGSLASHTFTHALCACEDLNLAAVLSTDSFDSSNPDRPIVSSGAAVGVGGSYPSARTNIGGSLTVSGTVRVSGSAGLDVQGDLRLAGDAVFYNQLTVKRDAWFVSQVSYWAVVTIGGNLNLAPPGAFLRGIGPEPIITGSRNTTTAFTVHEPCGCDDRIDVPAVAPARYDNAMYNIDAGALANVTSPTNLVLPCGNFRFDSIGGAGALTLTITGPTAIFVDTNVNLADSFQLAFVGPEAELDWFVRGNLSVGRAKLGDTKRPAATRIYVGGANDISLSSGEIGANIYAPNANVNIAAFAVAGSIYGKSLTMLGGGLVRYDRAVLNAGNKCPQPATCDKCHGCNGGAACMSGGVCGSCTDDGECCVPLVCIQGSCQPLLFP